jgi:hypothetical protein
MIKNQKLMSILSSRRGILLGLVVVSLTVIFRFWNLVDSHIFISDEGHNAWMASQILYQHKFITHGNPSYYGPLMHYLTAFLMSMFEPSAWLIRVIPALASIGASVLAWILLRRISNVWGALVGVSLMLLSPYVIEYGRQSMEMALNVLFITAAALGGYYYLKTQRSLWALATGLSIGAAANGHFYIVFMTIPFAVFSMLVTSSWQKKIISGVLVFVGAGITLLPVLLTMLETREEFFGIYTSRQASTGTLALMVTKMIGYTATLIRSAGGWLGLAILAAGMWGGYQAIWRRDRVALLFFVPMAFALVMMPLVVLPGIISETYDAGWCGRVSRMLGSKHCLPTHVRYLDPLYPLPLLMVAWAAVRLTQGNRWLLALIAAGLVLPLVQPALATVSATQPGRIGYLGPLLNQLPARACLVAYSADRDYKRLLALAGRRPVYFSIGNVYNQRPSACDGTYVVTTLDPLTGPHLELVASAEGEGRPLWYIYRLTQEGEVFGPGSPRTTTIETVPDEKVLDDVLCPVTAVDPARSGPRPYGWQFTTIPDFQSIPLQVLADCVDDPKSDGLEISRDSRTWYRACESGRSSDPKTRWINTSVVIEPNTRTPVSLYLRAENTDDPASLLKELRACPNVPRNIDKQLYLTPHLID